MEPKATATRAVPRMGARARYNGVTNGNVIDSFKACGIGAMGGADDHLIHCLKESNGLTNGLYVLTKSREATE